MRFRISVRLVRHSTVALLLTAAWSWTRLAGSDPDAAPSGPAADPSTYFPPPEAAGGWRTSTDATHIASLGIDSAALHSLGSYLMALPHERYYTSFGHHVTGLIDRLPLPLPPLSGYHEANKAAIVVKNGWIVGEYYNQPSAATAVYYLASNGKTFTIMLTGRMAEEYPAYGFGLASKLYDRRWLPQGFPLSDARKSDITFDHVFRHTSGILPEAERGIAAGSVRREPGWEFVPFTVGRDADYPQSARLYYPPGDPARYPRGNAYSSVAFNHFSLIFRNVTGIEPSEYLRREILDPIGVGRMTYKVTSGMGDYRWATSGNGLSSARDFARLGYLLLREGDWNGTRIFPAEWLRQFTSSPAYHNIRSNVDCRWGPKYPADMYRTAGSGQNWALVVPSLDLMLTFNGRTPSRLARAIEVEMLERLFAAVTEPYRACDGSLVNGTSYTASSVAY